MNASSGISGGNATIFVDDMSRSVEFYTETLGLALRMRAGDFWAEINAGNGFVIGLHPKSATGPAPGTKGSVQVGLLVSDPIERVVATLRDRGVEFAGPVVDDGNVKLAHFTDPDGTTLYLCEVLKQG